MRENPDVLVIGKMRTQEAMRLTLNASETGHLVLVTIHSSTRVSTLTMTYADALSKSHALTKQTLNLETESKLLQVLDSVLCLERTLLL